MSLPIYPVLPGLTYTLLKTPTFNTLDMKSPNSYEVRIAQTINPVWKFTLIYDFLHDFFWSGFTAVSELRTLMGFFLQVGGKAGSFLFTDPDDSNVGPALSTAPWVANNGYLLGQGILDSANHWQQALNAGISGGTVPTFSSSGGTVSDNGIVWQDMGTYSSAGIPNTLLAGLSLVSDGAGNYYSPIQRTLNGVFFEDVTDLNGTITVYQNGTLAVQGTDPNQYEVMGPGLALPTASYMGLYLKWASPFDVWHPNGTYATNAEILDPAGHIQKATTGGTSGSTIPAFNDTGGTTSDPAFIIWQDKGNATWAATHAYTLGQVIIDSAGHVQVVTTAGTSGSSIPTFNNAGGTTPDGGTLVWTDNGDAVWAAHNNYFAGQYIVASGHAQLATTSGESGASTPTFSTSGGTVDDPTGSVIWTDQGYNPGPTGPVTAQFNFYFRVRFDTDSQDFELWAGAGSAMGITPSGQGGGIWTIGGENSQNGSGTLILTTARPVPL